jgi:hypothetical protein
VRLCVVSLLLQLIDGNYQSIDMFAYLAILAIVVIQAAADPNTISWLFGNRTNNTLALQSGGELNMGSHRCLCRDVCLCILRHLAEKSAWQAEGKFLPLVAAFQELTSVSGREENDSFR